VSGFAGIVRLEPTPETVEADRAAVARMAEAIAFRGPDAQQQVVSDGATFAFSLLITGPAPQAPAQPITLDGETFLLGDLRLDRRRELVEKLVRHGEQCTEDASDEEIVLQAWKLWRKSGVQEVFFDELQGDYSFALWEPVRHELHCFRDVMGIRPFYYCLAPETFSFSNTLEALKHAPGFTSGLDREYVGDFLLVSDCPRPEHTIYQSVRKLPAGYWLTFSRQALKARRLREFPIEEPLWLKAPEEYVEIYQDLLERAVADRLPSTRTSIFLSGGMDSPSLAATICDLRRRTGAKHSLTAVTADSRPLFDDQEGRWAQKVADYLGIDFLLSYHGECAPFYGFESARSLFPEPFANPFRAIYLHLYRQSAALSRVVILGYGGDDVVTGGQTAAYLVYLAKKSKLAGALGELFRYVVKYQKLPPPRAGVRSRLMRWLNRADVEAGFPPWLAPGFARDLSLADRWQELQRQSPAIHPVHSNAYRGLSGTAWPHAFEKEDAAYTGLPLEVRLPLFDYRLLRFCLRLPVLPWCVDKAIMRAAMKGRLPEAVLSRKKAVLEQDPLALHHKKGDWPPRKLAVPADGMEQFVDWRLFLESRPGGRANLWRDVSVVALNLWLQNG
jgi:asparagine synthase (glutamine-hydrolysing)